MRGSKNPKNDTLAPRLSPVSVLGKFMEKFNDKFTAAVSGGTATVTTEKTTVKNPVAGPDGKFTEHEYSYPEISFKDVDAAVAYFSKPIEDKDGKIVGEGYHSSDGKTQQTPMELVLEALGKFVTNSEKARERAKTLSDLVPEDVKAIHKAARTMVLGGNFGGNKDEVITSETNLKAFAKALQILTAAKSA